MIYNAEKVRKELITYRKIDNNFSMQEMADFLKISKATYSRLENGKNPDLITYGKVVWFFTSNLPEYLNFN